MLSFVEKKLKDEFPGAHIPIVAGSAWWASSALNLDGMALDRLFERRSLGYLGELGLVPREELVRGAMEYAAHRERLRQALLATSGLPAMHRAVTDLMGSSQAAQCLGRSRDASGRLPAPARVPHAAEIESLTDARRAMATAPPRSQDQLLQLEQEARVLNEVGLQIGESGKNIGAQLAGIIQEEMDQLRSGLEWAVRGTHRWKAMF